MNWTINDNKKTAKKKNPIEALNEFEKNKDEDILFEQYFGSSSDHDGTKEKIAESQAAKPHRSEFTIFKAPDHRETQVVPHEIQELTREIRMEIEALKKANNSFIFEVEQVEKASLQSLPKKSGIYHVRFLEVLLGLLKNVRAKVGEAQTWMSAMHTKKAKRGSLFMVRSKKKGTQYSLSQELQNSRSVM